MLRDWIEGLKAAMPGQCAVCRSWPALPVGEACVVRLGQPQPRCLGCALPVPAGVERWGRCLREPAPLDRCVAAVSYGDPWSGLITQFKFHGQPGWARPLANLPSCPARTGSSPRWRKRSWCCRCRWRASAWSSAASTRRWNWRARWRRGKTRADLLLRVGNTASQAELGLAQRLRNVKGAFAVEPLAVAQVEGAAWCWRPT